MERSEKELRPYAETFLKLLQYWCSFNSEDYELLCRDNLITDMCGSMEELERYTARLKSLLDWERIEVMEGRLSALKFGEEVFTEGLVDTEDGVYLAAVMREARTRLEAELKGVKGDERLSD